MAEIAPGLRILHILNELRASGAEVMLTSAARLWREQDIYSEVLTIGQVAGDYAPNLGAAGITVHHLPFQRSLRFLRALKHFVHQHGYDLVHVHPESASFWTSLAVRAGGTPHIVRSVHSVFSFTGFLRFRRLVQRAILRRLGVTFISVSPSVQDNESIRFRNHSIYMRNWVDTQFFAPPTATQRHEAKKRFGVQDALVLTTVGNCAPVKNHEAVLQALATLNDLDPIYLHAGQEADGFPERDLASSLGIGERCRFLSNVGDVRELLHASDVYVMPSHHEGLSIAALEAAATGLPCVLARVDGLVDLVDVLPIGAIWTTPDPLSVAHAIRAASVIDRSAITTTLHRAITHEFGAETRVMDFARLYKLLVKSRAVV